jgi:hypothetical protein
MTYRHLRAAELADMRWQQIDFKAASQGRHAEHASADTLPGHRNIQNTTR